ncbi:MAG: hypothetical protein NXH73_06310 [Flavobacteriaceae bacterium]|nr:hypothetical protein [Flavobacteriaceae bacterium]
MKRKLGDIILQIIPVMIGVYLGFVISNWQDNQKRSTQSQILVDNISLEIETNKRIIEGVIEYHKMLRDSSRYYANLDIYNKKPTFFQGTRTQQLSSSAYSTGIQTGIINELPLKKIQTLNNLYNFQDYSNEFGKMLMNGLINMDFSDTSEGIKKIASFLSITMTDIVIQEQHLLELYEETNKILK